MAMMQDSYIADGTVKLLEVPFDANWLKVFNYTVSIAGGAGSVSESFWQQGMPTGVGYVKLAADDSLAPAVLAAANAIEKINTGDSILGTEAVIIGVTNAAPPVLNVAVAAPYLDNSIVRIRNLVGCTQMQGIDFTVATNDGTHFDLAYMVAPGNVGAAGNFAPLKWENPWYPRDRFIASITQAAQAVIQMTVTNEFVVGDAVRLMIPNLFGMSEANLKEVKVVAVDTDLATNTNTITVDLDTTAYTAFAWPLTGVNIPEFPQVLPLSGPVTNTAFRGFRLPAGVAAPGGVNNDVIYWVAGDSFGI